MEFKWNATEKQHSAGTGFLEVSGTDFQGWDPACPPRRRVKFCVAFRVARTHFRRAIAMLYVLQAAQPGDNCDHTGEIAMRPFHIAALAGAFVVAQVWSAQAQSLSELYEKAKLEKSLHLYGAGPAQNYEGPARDFEKQFPQIKITITGGYSNELNSKIEAQAKAGKFETDMAVFQTVQDFVKWKRDGILAHFKPPGFETLDPKFRDDDGAFVALYVSTISHAYNSIEISEAPKSALDYLAPRYKGKLITAYPHDDDATLYVFHTLIQKHGWDYVTRYMAQQPKFIQGHLGVARDVASGGSLATFDATVSTVGGLKRAGQPIEYAFSESEATPVFFVTAGLFKDAPQPNTARLYLTWLLAKEQQARSDFFLAARRHAAAGVAEAAGFV